MLGISAIAQLPLAGFPGKATTLVTIDCAVGSEALLHLDSDAGALLDFSALLQSDIVLPFEVKLFVAHDSGTITESVSGVRIDSAFWSDLIAGLQADDYANLASLLSTATQAGAPIEFIAASKTDIAAIIQALGTRVVDTFGRPITGRAGALIFTGQVGAVAIVGRIGATENK